MLDEEFENELGQFIQSMIDEEKNQSAEDLQKKNYYFQLLSEYLRRYHLTPEDDYSNVVPSSFELADGYDKRIEILEDALNKGINIQQSKLYPSILEGVVEDNHIIK